MYRKHWPINELQPDQEVALLRTIRQIARLADIQ